MVLTPLLLPVLLPITDTTTPALGGKVKLSRGADGTEHGRDARFVSANVAVLTNIEDDGLKTIVGSREREG
jgi:hypothetical protein